MLKSDTVAGDAVRFLLAGALNTGLTSAAYFAGLLVFSSSVSYALAWLLGFAITVTFYPDRVFLGSRATLEDRLNMGASILVVFSIGLATLHVLRGTLSSGVAAFLITLVATTILNFLITRKIMRKS
jgi:putative flippase GtrA